MNNISLNNIYKLLLKKKNFKELIINNKFYYKIPEKIIHLNISYLSYNSNNIKKNTLFFCKGYNFKKKYLLNILKNKKKIIYISEFPYKINNIIGIIVKNINKAMAIISMYFYNYPQKKLKIIAFTGTKGKTTSAHFTYNILNSKYKKKVAILSTINSTINGGKTVFNLNLTTPESIDIYNYMQKSIKNKIKFFILEISSQSYKQNRIFNLKYDIGIFLNISKDHISNIEHKNFEEYFYEKRKLLLNSKIIILNHDIIFFNFLKQFLTINNKNFITFGKNKNNNFFFNKKNENSFYFKKKINKNNLFYLNIPGIFNIYNAMSAISTCKLLNCNNFHCKQGLLKTKISGRMQKFFLKKKNKIIFIDYAHNYISFKNILIFLKKKYKNYKILLITGSVGNKSFSRRNDIAKIILKFIDFTILTTDNPDFEKPINICKQIINLLKKNKKNIKIILNRKKAIKYAIKNNKYNNMIIIIAGKGNENFQKIKGINEYYENDIKITKKIIKKYNN